MKKITSLNVVKTALSGGAKLSLLAFSISVLAAPPIPTLNIPVNNPANSVLWDGVTEITNVLKENIYFRWYSAGATSYRIIFSQNSGFTGYVELKGESSCADNTCTTQNLKCDNPDIPCDSIIRSMLLSGHKYYWAVRANTANVGYSEYAYGSFTTAGNAEPTPLLSFKPVNWDSTAYRGSNIFWKSGNAPQEFYPDPFSSKLGDAKGNCTWYVNGRLQQLGYDVSKLNKMTGMAKTWRDSAKKVGLVVDKKPTVGSILQTTAGKNGHVAVVEEVLPNGSLKISESSYIDTNAYPQLKEWDFKYRTRIIEKNKIPGYNYIHIPKSSNSGLVINTNATGNQNNNSGNQSTNINDFIETGIQTIGIVSNVVDVGTLGADHLGYFERMKNLIGKYSAVLKSMKGYPKVLKGANPDALLNALVQLPEKEAEEIFDFLANGDKKGLDNYLKNTNIAKSKLTNISNALNKLGYFFTALTVTTESAELLAKINSSQASTEDYMKWTANVGTSGGLLGVSLSGFAGATSAAAAGGLIYAAIPLGKWIAELSAGETFDESQERYITGLYQMQATLSNFDSGTVALLAKNGDSNLMQNIKDRTQLGRTRISDVIALLNADISDLNSWESRLAHGYNFSSGQREKIVAELTNMRDKLNERYTQYEQITTSLALLGVNLYKSNMKMEITNKAMALSGY
jgi:surface antigen